ncbi:hypothetical protein D3C76_1282430 [compost metagenome]
MDTKVSERMEVEANAQVIANIRIGHRTDIGRYRRLANKLLEELEGLTDNRELFEQLGELLVSPDDSGMDRLNDLYRKVIDLPNRTKVMKELGETLKNLIALERQAYDVGTEPPANDLSKMKEEEIDRRIAQLSGNAS